MPSSRRALAAALAVLTLGAAAAGRTDLVRGMELKSLDWRFRRFPVPAARDPGITLLMVDQQSLDEFEKDDVSWPWPRGFYAAILDYCRTGGAKAVVFDILLTSPSQNARDQDEKLARSLKRMNSVLAMETGGGTARNPIPILKEAAGRVGDAAARPDSDGVFRSVPLYSEAAGVRYDSLAAAAVLAVSSSKEASIDGAVLRLGDYAVPLTDGRLMIRFRGPHPYPTLPAGRIVRAWGNIEEGLPASPPPSSLKDRIVMVGLSAPGLMDLRPTPVAERSPGTEVVAAAVDNILTGDFLRPAPRAAGLLLALLAVLAGASAALRLSRAWAAGLAVVGASFLLVAAAVVSFRHGVWLEMAVPQLALWLSFAAGSAWGYAVEGQKKREITRAFSLYLAPQMVARIAESPDSLVLGGERRELSCYFSDIENFTNFSEKLSPEKLTALMNRYLGEMTDTILESGGTLDKYIGDAIMAFWGAPMPRADHALAACRVALRNQEKLAVLREALVREGYPVVKARIGLNSGTASVGNMGSSQRFSYTALGDDINLASRLEGANKVYGTYILVSHATRVGAGAAVEVRELDLLKVKGKDKAVPVYELLGLAGAVDPAVLARARRFEEALRLCRSRSFKEALSSFEAYLCEHPADKAGKLYVDRCRAMLESPPPEGWDGSFALTEK